MNELEEHTVSEIEKKPEIQDQVMNENDSFNKGLFIGVFSTFCFFCFVGLFISLQNFIFGEISIGNSVALLLMPAFVVLASKIYRGRWDEI